MSQSPRTKIMNVGVDRAPDTLHSLLHADTTLQGQSVGLALCPCSVSTSRTLAAILLRCAGWVVSLHTPRWGRWPRHQVELCPICKMVVVWGSHMTGTGLL